MKMPDQSAGAWAKCGGLVEVVCGVRGGTAMAQAVSVSSQQLPGPPVPLYQPTLVSIM